MVNKEERGYSEFGVKFFTWVGFILVPMAILMPFMVIYFDLSSWGKDFGAVGDFIGGTTVTFLTGASVFLLIATNIMQRKELQMSRQSIDEMVKQTEASVEQMAASVQQAEEARKETQITNETMRRQQFETTFFNMLTLHQTKVDNMQFDNKMGQQIIELCLRYMKRKYSVYVTQEFKEAYIENSFSEITDLYECLNDTGYGSYENIPNISNQEEIKIDFKKLDFELVHNFIPDNSMVVAYFEKIEGDFEEHQITPAYQKMFWKYGSVLSSYINGLCTIIKFLRDNEYEKEDRKNNTQKYKIYREILFSQMSSKEMMLLYYHAHYSEKDTWLKEELPLYNVFYPNLLESHYMFVPVDKSNIDSHINVYV